jgi:Rrf2 family protein
MKISTRGRYGTRLLLDLALHQGESPIALRDIAGRQQISQQYIEQLITPLAAAGLVKTSRGQKGGAWLAKPPEEIKIREIIMVLEGGVSPVDCVINPERCQRSGS